MTAANGSAPRILVPEICQRLQLSERTVYGLLEDGVIPSLRLRKRYIIGRQAYEEWERNLGKRNTFALQFDHEENTDKKYH